MGYKDAAHKKMIDVYEKYGKEKSLACAEEILHSPVKGDDIQFKMELHGEVCECVLEILIRDEIKKNPRAKDWIFLKSTVLKDRANLKSDFMTEIDFMLFTPECIYLFECKSYTGDKLLVRDGYLVRGQETGFDVYKQSLLHKEVLERWVEGFQIKGKVPLIQMCMFNFSNGVLTDRRSRAAKMTMPCLNKDNVISYVLENKEPVWEMAALRHVKEVFDKNSEKFRGKHLQYVKNLHRR